MITKDGLGYGLITIGGVVKLKYNYVGYSRTMDIDESYWETLNNKVSYWDDGLDPEVDDPTGYKDVPYLSIKDHDDVFQLIKTDIEDNVEESTKFIQWAISNHLPDKAILSADSEVSIDGNENKKKIFKNENKQVNVYSDEGTIRQYVLNELKAYTKDEMNTVIDKKDDIDYKKYKDTDDREAWGNVHIDKYGIFDLEPRTVKTVPHINKYMIYKDI